MADNELSVSFGADTSDLKDGVSQASDLIKALGAPIAQMAQAAAEMSTVVAQAFRAVSAAAPTGALGALKGLFGEVGGSAEAAAAGAQGAGAAMGGVAEAGASAGVAFAILQAAAKATKSAFDAFRVTMQLTGQSLDWSGEISDSAAQLGIGAEALQQYRTAAQAAGVGSAEFMGSMQGLSTALGDVQSGLGDAKPQMETFTKLGFTQDQLNGFTSVDELLPAIADRLKSVGSEAERAAIADRLGIRPLLPLLEKGSADLEALRQKAADAGGEIDGKTAAAMRQLKTDTDLASQGIDGNLKTAFIGLAPALEGTLKLLNQLSRAFSDFMQGFVSLDKRTTQSLQDGAANLAQKIAELRRAPGAAATTQIAAYQAELDKINQEIQAREKLGATAPNPATSDPGSANGRGSPGHGPVATGGGAASAAPSGAAPAADGAAQVQAYVASQEAAFRAVQEANAATLHNEAADELAFWRSSLAEANLTGAQTLAVKQKVAGLEAQLSRQSLQSQIQDDREAEQQHVAAIDKSLEAKKRELDQEIKATESAASRGELSRAAASARIERLIDAEVTAETDAAIAIYDAKSRLDAQIMSLNDQDTAQYIAAAKDEVAAERQKQDALTAAQADGSAKRLQATRAETAAFKRSWDSTVNPVVSSFDSGVEKMIEGTETFRQAMTRVGQRILDDFVSKVVDKKVEAWLWGDAEQVVAETNWNAFLATINTRETASVVVQQGAQTAAVATGVAARTSAQQIGATKSLAIGGQAALKDIMNSAAQAAAGASKSLAGIPIIGPALGAAAAVASFAAVAAYEGLVASAEGGFDIPPGVNPITQLHQQEMVLPAALANPMRAFLGDYPAGGQRPALSTPMQAKLADVGAGGGGAADQSFHFGDFTVHGAPSGMSSGEFRQALTDHATHVAAAVAGALRNGYQPPYRQPTGRL